MNLDRKGQSLVELAAFGAILLFCLAVLIQYGMSANYQQNTQMQAFRHAMMTSHGSSGPSTPTSFSETQDVGMADPRDPWGDPQRFPVTASGSVTWDSTLQGGYISDWGDVEDDGDLPRQLYLINEDEHGYLAALHDVKTAAFGRGGCVGDITVVFENIEIGKTSEYITHNVACGQIKVYNRRIWADEEAPGEQHAYYRLADWTGGLKYSVTSADVDNDGHIEMVYAVRGTIDPCRDDGYCGGVATFRYVDYQNAGLGDIDADYVVINPWDHHLDIDDQQGMLTNYRVSHTTGHSMTKTDTNASISTTTSYGGSQSVRHYLRDNQGNMVILDETDFSPPVGFTWGVSK